MCAECHSTGVVKHYDATADRFATGWAEISVGCEACHGQGSRHAAWARGTESWWPFGKREDLSKGLLVRFDERHDVAWPIDPKTGTARRSVAPATLRKEVETCGLCHARRAGFNEDWVPGQWLSQTHVVEPLARTTYHADGQIRDVEEAVQLYAVQAEPDVCRRRHLQRLPRAACRETPILRRSVCLQCHVSDKYADAKHRHHESVDPPPGCTSCHMPARTYMVVDQRHDHSFRVPRPDLSVTLGTPNACNSCHGDKSPAWAANAIEQWFGPKREGFQTYAAAFHAARTDQADAAALLGVIAAGRNVPAVARASALDELASRVSSANIGPARSALSIPTRCCASGRWTCWKTCQPSRIWPLASPLLSDPVRGVRIRAASLLAGVPTASQPRADRARFDAGGQGVCRRPARQRDAAGSPHHACEFSRPARTGGRGRDRIQGGATAQPAICGRRRQSGRPLPATRTRRRRRNCSAHRA